MNSNLIHCMWAKEGTPVFTVVTKIINISSRKRLNSILPITMQKDDAEDSAILKS